MADDLHSVDLSPTVPVEPVAGRPPTRHEVLRSEIAALDQLDLTALRQRWRQLYRTAAPVGFRHDLLIRAIAYKLQEKAFGGLAPSTRRKLLRIAAEAESADGFTTADAPRHLRAGTRLIRDWKGTVHTVEVLDGGFEWDGQHFTSLSAIAKEITGTSWNGHTFFGVGRKKRNEDGDDA
ncbi:MAG TPA: DUF2924 domain-containing protein [Devosia sp.]|jgi:hypothetical protein|uniref:DUF2924 domain-containing protein n=1 Tax=Devosia sp. TaxID=1871048 RepID=UPI002DDC9C84|nr:DUF2924 domain-containing protein [Devosia sp.]HEV2516052.1 DUF2924 domain-containing protein [Devosia sp.]